MVLQSRVLDAVIMGEELVTAGTETTAYTVNALGDIVSCTLSITENKKVINGITGGTTTGHLPSRIVGLIVTPAGNITFHPQDLKFTKYVIPDYVEAMGNYTMANRSTALPKSLSLKGAYDGTKGIRHLGVFLTNVKYSCNDDDILTCTADLVSLFADTFTGTVTYTPPTGLPLTFAGTTFTFAGNEWNLQSVNLGYDPKFIQKFGMATKTTGKIRFPTQIIRGGKVGITFDGVANIENTIVEIEAIQGGTSAKDYPTNATIILTFIDSLAKTHAITLSGQVSNYEVGQSDSENNSKTMVFSGAGTDFTVTGVL